MLEALLANSKTDGLFISVRHRVTSTKVTCLTSAVPTTSGGDVRKRSLPSAVVMVTIDGMVATSDDVFVYREDPELTGVEPRKSIVRSVLWRRATGGCVCEMSSLFVWFVYFLYLYSRIYIYLYLVTVCSLDASFGIACPVQCTRL